MANKEKTASKGSGISKRQGQFICIVLLILAIAAYIYLGVMYTSETKDQDKLNDQIDQRQPILTRLEDRSPEKLDDLLEEKQAELITKREIIPLAKDTTDVQEMLLAVADSTGVNILPMGKVSLPSSVKFGGIPYQKVSFNLNPKGSYAQVIAFIDELENGDSVVVNGATFSLQTSTVESLSLTGRGNEWTARLAGSFYSRADTGE